MELELSGVSVRRGARSQPSVLDGIDLRITAGERIAIMGANGAGKSTLGLVLAGALELERGSMRGPAQGAVRAVLQRPEASFLTEYVVDEVALGAEWNGASSAAARSTATATLARLGLGAEFAQRDPLTLSGGEQRRVAIGAVLATNPRIVVLDEPSAGLDAAARAALLDTIAAVHTDGRTVVTITHDADEAARVADRLIVLSAGRIAYDGPIDPVLGDPAAAHALGLEAAPEVQVLRALAERHGYDAPRIAHPERALDRARQLVGAAASTSPAGARVPGRASAAPPRAVGAARFPDPRVNLPRAVDARVRIVAALAAIVAGLLAHTLVAAGVVIVAISVVFLASAPARARSRVVLRPLVTLAVMLVALQYAFGRDVQVEIVTGVERAIPALVALHRVFQIGSVLLASLLLTAATTAQDIGAALRWFFAPLRVLRVPVDDFALVVATALAILPALDAELERIRVARTARGIRARGRGPRARIQLEALVLMPLLVTSFRRARLLADALVVRGADPRAEPTVWRPRHVPGSDLTLLVSAMILVLVAWFV